MKNARLGRLRNPPCLLLFLVSRAFILPSRANMKSTLISIGLLLAGTQLAIGEVAGPPNVIIVIADDQGYGDLGCHGNPVVRTPHLDQLHRESLRFTQFHVAPMCTPTRGQLMTGVARMRSQLDGWWNGLKDHVNEPQRVVIGGVENPTMLTACEWWDVFVDQQAQVRRGDPKNGVWHIEVAAPGEYEIELRRWPREAGLALAAEAPAETLTDGKLPAGRALAVAAARIQVQGQAQRVSVSASQEAAVFRVPLRAGPTTLQSWFLNAADAPICGAYYAYIRKM